jgi:hypothetical protein
MAYLTPSRPKPESLVPPKGHVVDAEGGHVVDHDAAHLQLLEGAQGVAWSQAPSFGGQASLALGAYDLDLLTGTQDGEPVVS